MSQERHGWLHPSLSQRLRNTIKKQLHETLRLGAVPLAGMQGADQDYAGELVGMTDDEDED
jgi:hypothetical protein